MASRIRKTSYVIKSLRHSAPENILLHVYKALCQSLIVYCIGVWGGAAKSTMIDVERAQRSVLKVMLGKPFRYSSDQLYKDCELLRVRQLFILRGVISMHKVAITSPDHEHRLKQRVYRIPVPFSRTTFAKRHPYYLLPRLYNRVQSKIKIKDLSIHDLKQELEHWLLGLDYAETENLL